MLTVLEVYTLWSHPKLLPLLHTPEIVVQKMRAGADLMTPGLGRGPPFPAGAKEGALAAVACYENPSVPLVVGNCEIDVGALTEVKGSKGNAVSPIHTHGDELWSWSQNWKPGEEPADYINGWLEEEGTGLEEEVENLTVGDSDQEEAGGVPLSDESKKRNEFVEGEDPEEHEHVSAPSREWAVKGNYHRRFYFRELTLVPDIDNAFRQAFIFAMHTARNEKKDGPKHGIDFPIPQSQLISNYILPYLPIFTPEDATSLQIKKTSWKNIRKFIKALEKERLLKSKDRNGGETVILDVDFDNQAINNFTPYRLPKKEQSTNTDSCPSTNTGDRSIGQSLKRLGFLKPKEKHLPIFSSSSNSIHTLYLTSELRPIITTYLESENLIHPTNKRLVRINPVLANAVFDSSSSLDQEVLAKGTVPREVLIERIISSCSPYYSILLNSSSREDSKPKSGHPPSIKLTSETRSGNKTVTKLSGVEAYYIHPQALAEELQKSCASSTSVTQLIGSSPKTPVMEIMVQGPQKNSILKALERRGVRREWVEILDRSRGKKK